VEGGSTYPPFKLRHVGVFTFNDKNKIVSFDLTIPYLGTLLDQPAGQAAVIASVCQRHESYCTATPQQQYENTAECESFLSSIAFPGSP
jgi:hypothetical protein